MIQVGTHVRVPGGDVGRVIGQMGDTVHVQVPSSGGKPPRKLALREHAVEVVAGDRTPIVKNGPGSVVEDEESARQGETEPVNAMSPAEQDHHAAIGEDLKREAELDAEEDHEAALDDAEETEPVDAQSTEQQGREGAEQIAEDLAAEIEPILEADLPASNETATVTELIDRAASGELPLDAEFRARMRGALLVHRREHFRREAVAAHARDPDVAAPAPEPERAAPIVDRAADGAPAPTIEGVGTVTNPPAPAGEDAPPADPASAGDAPTL